MCNPSLDVSRLNRTKEKDDVSRRSISLVEKRERKRWHNVTRSSRSRLFVLTLDSQSSETTRTNDQIEEWTSSSWWNCFRFESLLNKVHPCLIDHLVETHFQSTTELSWKKMSQLWLSILSSFGWDIFQRAFARVERVEHAQLPSIDWELSSKVCSTVDENKSTDLATIFCSFSLRTRYRWQNDNSEYFIVDDQRRRNPFVVARQSAQCDQSFSWNGY